MNELYLHLHAVNHDGMTLIDTRSEWFYDRLQRRRLELTQATSDQPVDDEAVYLNVVGECPKGRVYGLGFLGRKKRRYADPGASTSQMPKMVSRAEFDIVADQLRKPSPGLPSTHHQKEACSFRDQTLLVISDTMSRLEELALSLVHKCLSFDFVGTSLDESSEEFGTVCLEASSGRSFKPSNIFLLLCNRIFTYLKGGFGVIGTISCCKVFSVRKRCSAFKVCGQGLADHDNYHDEGAVGVNGSHGFRNLAGIVQFGTWAYRGPCFNQLRDITSLDASSYGYSHIGSLREMFLRSFTVDVSGLDKTILGATQCRGCIERPEEKRYGVSLKKSSRTAAEGLRALVKNDKEKILEAMFADLVHFSVRSILIVFGRNAVELFDTTDLERAHVTELQDGSALFIIVAKYLSPSRHDIDQVGITTDVQCTTDMLTSTRGLSSKDNKGTSSSLEADSCIMVKHQRRRKELTQTTPDQPLDDEAVYYKVAGDCPKGCVYSLRSLWRKKRRYVDPNASTSQVLAQRAMSNFMILSIPKELFEGLQAMEQWSQLRSSLISCHSSVLPCRGPPCSVLRSPTAGPLSSLLSCSSSFLRRCYLLYVSASGAAATSLAVAAHSFLPFWSISTELLPVYIDALELPCMLTGLLSRDPYAPYPCIPTETDAENILCVGFGKETMGVRK
ncbi:hypothetical protein Syun_018704 [Stephania yunnanensis]|uniref:Uncharacterized protein n=1 Tax=Stephania yunnanensis TaxID=152371 RepID=A0AAP0NV98_9MAGN